MESLREMGYKTVAMALQKRFCGEFEIQRGKQKKKLAILLGTEGKDSTRKPWSCVITQ